MIAIAIANNPDILLADEPTTALDVTIQSQIFRLIRDIQARFGMAMILITHDLGLVAGIADRIAVMYAGRVVEEGPTDQIYYDPQPPLHPRPPRRRAAPRRRRRRAAPHHRGPAAGAHRPARRLRLRPALPLRHAHLPRARPRRLHAGPRQPHRLLAAPPGRAKPRAPPSSPRGRRERVRILETCAACARLRRPGGRTLNAVAASTSPSPAARPSASSASPAAASPPSAAPSWASTRPPPARSIFEDAPRPHRRPRPPRLHPPHADGLPGPLFLAQPAHDRGRDHRRGPRDPPHGHAAPSARRASARSCAPSASTPTYENRFPHEFSGGQRQRIAIARALGRRARDGHLRRADLARSTSRSRARSSTCCSRLQDERGLTYLFVAHDLLMVKYISDRVGVMYLGRLVEVAPTEELFAQPAAPLHPGAPLLGPDPRPASRARARRAHPRGRAAEPLRRESPAAPSATAARTPAKPAAPSAPSSPKPPPATG